MVRHATNLGLLASLLLAGCAPGSVGFNFTQALGEQRVPGDHNAHVAAVALAGQNPIGPVSLSVDLAAQNQSYQIVIQRVRLMALSFNTTATAQPQGCFDFVSTATINVESSLAGSSLPSVQIANASNPGCVNTLAFSVDNTVNIKPYIQEGMRLRLTLDGVPPDSDVTFDGSLTMRAEAL